MKFVDLFAGIGGFRQAAQRALGSDATCVAWCESDPLCQRLYRLAYRSSQEVHVDDVRRIASGKRCAVDLPPFDALFAGFPCQSFSNVGKRTGLNDSRGELFFDILRILNVYKPKMFVLENVQKIKTIEGGQLLERMVADLRRAGYLVNTWDMLASAYGVPQQRRRIFFSGRLQSSISDKLNLPLPDPISVEEWRYPTAWHLLENEMNPRHLIPLKTRETVLRKNPKWAGDLQIDRAIARPITASMSKWHRANQDNYYSQTYIEQGGKQPFQPPSVDWASEPIRRITPLEGFRLQGFPDQMVSFANSLNIAFSPLYRLIGNSVPVPMAEAAIRQTLRGL